MPVHKVNVKWGKNKYDDVELDTDESPDLFKAQVFALSGVPPERQKLMLKGKTIEGSWSGIKLSDGITIMMMGSTDAIPVAPTGGSNAESGKDAADSEENEIPLGLTNLGNTCYLNATLQCFRAVPELRKALKGFGGKFVGWDNDQSKAQSLTAAMKSLYDEMDRYPDRVVPMVMVETLRKAYPRFAETGEHGAYMQQDANEAWTELMSNLRQQLPSVAPAEYDGGDSGSGGGSSSAASHGSADKRDVRNAIEQYMFGEFDVTMKCKESETEPVVQFKEKFLQLSCFISQDMKYMQAGLAGRMKETITKRADSLGRDAEFEKVLKISRLPAHLTVQQVRFFFKTSATGRTAAGVKILKDVKFPLSLDVFDLCSEELQKKLTPNRLKFKEFEEAAMERAVKRSKLLDKGGKVEDVSSKSTKFAPYWFEDDIGSNNSGYYDLEAVLTHQGRTSDSGHYVAWVRRSQDIWIKFDDEKVTPVSAEEILKLSGGGDWHCAYLLLYGPRKLALVPKEDTSASAGAAATTATLNSDMPID